MLQPAPTNPQQTISAIRHLPAQKSVSPSPMPNSVATQYTLLPTKYSYPVSAPCTYPAFNPPASSQLPTNPQELPPATVISSLPYPNPPFQSAAPPTYRDSVTKPKKRLKFFPTKTILLLTQPASTPTNLFQPESDVPAFQPDVPAFQSDVSLPAAQLNDLEPAAQSNEPLSSAQPDVFLSAAQPDVFLSAAQPDVFLSAAQPDLFLSTAQPDVFLSAAQPDVFLSAAQPDVFLSAAQPDVFLSAAQPDVLLSVAQPDVFLSAASR
ncbi:hypothetical protein AB205_0062910, partial [Aquarana catesbeiana]